MLPTNPFQKDEVVLPNDELQRYLSNRKHLDFALKLALGSQAYLHDISSIHSGSNMSFESFDNRLSPVRSADESIDKRIRGQKSKFGEKENNSRLSNFRSVEKSAVRKSQTIEQERQNDNRLQCIQVWMEFVRDRCKLFTREPLNVSRMTQRSKRKESLQTKEGINQFFREIVFLLERLEMVEKQEYNSKLLLCQLTEATLRESELQEKVQILKKEVHQKKTVIGEQEKIIVRLLNNKRFERQPLQKFERQPLQPFFSTIKKQSSPKISPTESLLRYSLSEGEDQNTITKQVHLVQSRQDQFQQAEEDKSAASPNAKQQNPGLQFFESPIKKSDHCEFVYETTAGYLAETPTVKNLLRADQLFEETERQLRENDCEGEKEKSAEESMLLDYLGGQKTMNKLGDPVKEKELINQAQQNCSLSKSSCENSKWFMPNQTKQDQPSICQKISDSAMLEIREEVERLIMQNQDLKNQVSRLQQEVDSLKQKQQHQEKQQSSCNHSRNLLQLPVYNKQVNDTATQYQSEYAANDLHQNSNLLNSESTRIHLNTENENIDIISNLGDKIDVNGENHLSKEGENPNKFLKPHFFKTNKSPFEQQSNKCQDKSLGQENDESNLLQDSSSFKYQTPQNYKIFQNIENQQTSKANNIKPQLKQTILLLIEDNRKLLQKLRRKKAELKQIRQIIKKAKEINDEDMHKLENTIQHRQVRRSKEISELKEMEIKWNTNFREARSAKTKKTQLLNEQLQLKVNSKIFKFVVPKSKKNA